MPPDEISLPPSAADLDATGAMVDLGDAYLRNPIVDREMLTPLEVVDAISLLSAMLLGDERYRIMLASRKAPDGN